MCRSVESTCCCYNYDMLMIYGCENAIHRLCNDNTPVESPHALAVFALAIIMDWTELKEPTEATKRKRSWRGA